MSISDEKRYEFVTNQLRYFDDRIRESFGLFVKLSTAIVGGAAWTLTQQLPPETRRIIHSLFPWMISAVGVSSIVLIVINLRIWWGYRKAEASLAGVDRVPLPRFPGSASSEIVLVSLIAAGVVASWVLNPF